MQAVLYYMRNRYHSVISNFMARGKSLVLIDSMHFPQVVLRKDIGRSNLEDSFYNCADQTLRPGPFSLVRLSSTLIEKIAFKVWSMQWLSNY